MSFFAYLAVGAIAGDAFTEAEAVDYVRQSVTVIPRNAQGRATYGGQLGAETIVNGASPNGRSSIIFAGPVTADAQAIYADQAGGEPLAWWPAEADAPEPYTREAGEIGVTPQGGSFELVLDRMSGVPVPRTAQD